MRLPVCTGLALLTALACAPEPAESARNLVLISIDTLRPDMLGCYGFEGETSPALDRFAAQGALFEDVTSTSPWTLPAHSSLLTGLYPNRHGMKSHERFLPESVVTLAETLRNAGLHTGAVVHNHNLSERYGLNRGFADFRYIEPEIAQSEPSPVEEHALSWLAEQESRRFFLFLHFYDVHSDYTSLPQYEQMFERTPGAKADGTTEQMMEHRDGQIEFDERDVERLRELYQAGIRQMDDGVSRLLRALDARPDADDTLVIITSDHGEEFLEHGGVLHGRTQYQEVLRVPLLLRGPGIPGGLRISTPVSLVDVMPTALALLGVAPPPDLDGADLTPLLRGEAPEELASRYLFGDADHYNPQEDMTRSVRHKNFKLHLDRSTGAWRFFDLERDPLERTDSRAEHPEVFSDLRKRIEELMAVQVQGRKLEALTEEEKEKLKALGYLAR